MVLEVTQIEIGIPGSSSVFTQTLKLRGSKMPVSRTKCLPRARLPCGARFVSGASCATEATPIHMKRHCVSKWDGDTSHPNLLFFFEIDTVDKLVKHKA